MQEADICGVDVAKVVRAVARNNNRLTIYGFGQQDGFYELATATPDNDGWEYTYRFSDYDVLGYVGLATTKLEY